jgi:hypothetical protein
MGWELLELEEEEWNQINFEHCFYEEGQMKTLLLLLKLLSPFQLS